MNFWRFSKSKTLILTLLISGTATILLLGTISLQSSRAVHQAPLPQAILVLEGNTERIEFAAQFAKSHPNLPIWISGNPDGLELNQSIFQQAGISTQHLNFDFCATDTVTNFTCNVKTFVNKDIHHVYLITSNYHMARSQAIATLVFGIHGIVVTPVPVVANHYQPESWLRTFRDCIRSVIWMVTGRTGARFNPALYHH